MVLYISTPGFLRRIRGRADSYAWAIMILDEVLPYQDMTDLKENGNLPAEFNVNLITAFKVDVKVS